VFLTNNLQPRGVLFLTPKPIKVCIM